MRQFRDDWWCRWRWRYRGIEIKDGGGELSFRATGQVFSTVQYCDRQKRFNEFVFNGRNKPNFSLSTTFRCNLSAPATVADLGPGFDFLGCAVDGIGDYVTLRVDPDVHPGEISISEKLSKNPLWNCAGIAAISVMKMLNIRSLGLSLSLEKGLPLGSGLRSSAASASAAAVAVNELFGGPLSVSVLVLAGL
ncbi:homoserine kinase-like [Cornus florida]|uniref:homoserine kinase-like n=1 Tax=Cornus florida TaxID=4283 RepID=UPI00289C0BA2|nr:homoserine kinase-like [Cornus florida]